MEVQKRTAASCVNDSAVEEPHADHEPPSSTKCDAAMNACFDCNICLDFTAEPVVTLCGHLYCWPCIYMWLQTAESGGGEGVAQSRRCCPVCKAPLSLDALVPLYGRGLAAKGADRSLEIPRRPSAARRATMMASAAQDRHPPVLQQQHHYPYHHSDGYDDNYVASPSPMGATASVFHSTAGGVLAMLPWLSRNHAAAGRMYYSSPYVLAAAGNDARLRRRELVVGDSLHQLWVLLFCCALLCLLFF